MRKQLRFKALFTAPLLGLLLGFGANAQAAPTAFWSVGTDCNGGTSITYPAGTTNRTATASLCVRNFDPNQYVCDFAAKVRTPNAAQDGLFSVKTFTRNAKLTDGVPTTDITPWPITAAVSPTSADLGGGATVITQPVDPTLTGGVILLATYTFSIADTAGAGPYSIDLTTAATGYPSNIGTSTSPSSCSGETWTDFTAISLELKQLVPPPDTTAPVMGAMACGATLTNVNTKSFTFTATDNVGVTGYECTLDGTAATCTSPRSVGPLADGAHTFSVRAKDAAGNWSTPTPTCSWTVDTTPPAAPTITTKPANPSTSQSAQFAFTGEAGATFQCSLNSGAYTTCTSGQTWTLSAPGNQTFSVRAVDAAGNTGPAAAPYNWVANFTPAAVVPTTVPTLSEWSLILLGLLLAGFGITRHRRMR